MEEKKDKAKYETPELTKFGTVEELTLGGQAGTTDALRPGASPAL